METFIRISLIVHIAAGCVALVSGLAAILLRKKVKLHRKAGKVYFWCMNIIFVTALYVSVYKENYFLLLIAIFTFHASTTAYRSLKLKKLHQGQKPLFIDWLIETLNITANGGLVVLGIYFLISHNIQWSIICFAFGSLGLRGSYHNIQRLRGKVTGSSYWLIAHISGMVGSYIGAITAFLVNNNRWIGMPDVITWLLPTVLLVPFIISETAKLKPKSSTLA